MRSTFRMFTLAALAIAIAAPTGTNAQNIGLTRPGRLGFALEATRAQFKNVEGFKFPTSAMFVSGYAAVSPRAVLVLEVPVAHASFGDNNRADSSTGLGNPYAGVQLRWSGMTLDAGARLPLASEDNGAALFIGAISELDRIEAFIPEFASFSAMMRAGQSTEDGWSMSVFGGPSLMINTGDAELNDDRELLLTYGLEPSFRSGAGEFGARVVGRFMASEEGTFGERSVHQAGIFANLGRGAVRPGFQLRVPLDADLRDDLSWILGFNLRITINR